MRILGHNLLPFSVLNLGSGWASGAATGIVANCFFFDTAIADQGDFSQHLLDLRNLTNNAVAATRIVLHPTTEGLLPLADLQEGWKARSGHVYEIKNGATIHYPSKATPVGYNGAASVQINTAYATSNDAGNKALWGIGPAGYRAWDYAGVPHDSLMPGIHLSTTDLTFDYDVTINAVLSAVGDMTSAAAGTIAPIDGAGTVGTAVAWTLAANQEGNAIATAIPAGKRYRFIQTSGTRRVLPVTASDVGRTAAYKTMRSALVVIQDTNYGALANGNYIPTYFACEVGAIGSGKPIELLATALGPGDFASVAQLRLSTEV
ncbi:hypothetical protein HOT49_gp090 [Erwinia phage vB_EamM_Alexandra]|uniref:Uncharacterized protein n=1 Tax=Erwinia phage vB_EamM_Alexandra TaxID=2201424 RepID=A0A2Z4QF80_9CAUD|nr:hypothetical protein HOT49_gp090 [Erwinia phage vB_EamM_Alexandra]AWY08366.1 hypothetical protein Alexandra_90 [Erwinia phage vB_EamM_Alexandra]